MLADVHIFAVVRVKVPRVAGMDDQECIRRACAHVDLGSLFQFAADSAREEDAIGTEYAEEVVRYLVDPWRDGQPDLDNARWYLDRQHAEAANEDLNLDFRCLPVPLERQVQVAIAETTKRLPDVGAGTGAKLIRVRDREPMLRVDADR